MEQTRNDGAAIGLMQFKATMSHVPKVFGGLICLVLIYPWLLLTQFYTNISKWSKLVWEWVNQHGGSNDSPTIIRIIPAVTPPNIITTDIDLASYSTKYE